MKPIGVGRKLPTPFSLMIALIKTLFIAMVPGLASVLVEWVRVKLLRRKSKRKN